MQRSFYYRFYPVLMRICIRYAPSREDAEQWVHDGFIKIFSSLSKYQRTGSFEGWVKKLIVRYSIDQWRTLQTRKFETENSTVYINEDPNLNTPFVSNDFFRKAEGEDLLKLIQSLPEKPRMVFNMIVIEDFSHKEVAETLQITENHSYLLLHQARKQLRHLLQKPSKKCKYEQK